MAGDIYTEQKCPICQGKLLHDQKRRGLFCSIHQEQRASKFYVKFGRGVKRRFPSYDRADRFLNELRVKCDKGLFDPVDYRKDSPNSFRAQAEQYLSEKAHLKDYGKVKLMIDRASAFFGLENVKDISRQRIKAYLATLDGADKTRANYRNALATFFRWLEDEEVIRRVPAIQRIEYQLAYRAIVDMGAQRRILDKIKEQAPDKVALGVEMLATYPALRPGDLFRIREQDIRLDQACILIWRPTKKKDGRKVIPLLAEHVSRIKSLKAQYPAMPEAPFFRHAKPNPGRQLPFNAFGAMVFRKAWDKACEALGIEGVDLYGGTRHSTATALAAEFGRDEVKAATQHGTDAAFDRYCQAAHIASIPMAKAVEKLWRRGPAVVQADFQSKKN